MCVNQDDQDHHEMTPIKSVIELTPSEAGSGEEDEDNIQQIDSDSQSQSQSQSLLKGVNLKHYSHSSRLHDTSVIGVLQRRDQEVSSNKKTNDSSKIKSSSHTSKSAPVSSVKKSVPNQKKLSAMERYKLNKFKEQEEENDIEQREPTPPPPKSKKVGSNPSNTLLKKGKSAQPKGQVPSTSSGQNKAPHARYDVSLDSVDDNAIYSHETGIGHRRLKELQKKKKKEEESEVAEAVREKNQAIIKMTDTFTRMASVPTPTARPTTSPEQLWADSLVPHVTAMQPTVRADFMVYVLGVALKANMGLWPEKK